MKIFGFHNEIEILVALAGYVAGTAKQRKTGMVKTAALLALLFVGKEILRTRQTLAICIMRGNTACIRLEGVAPAVVRWMR